MRAPRPSLFVARSTYRRRRLRDAARMLPVLGAVLMLLPMLWGNPSDTGGRNTAVDGIYLFAIWAGLIIAAWLMAPGLGPDPAEPADPGGED